MSRISKASCNSVKTWLGIYYRIRICRATYIRVVISCVPCKRRTKVLVFPRNVQCDDQNMSSNRKFDGRDTSWDEICCISCREKYRVRRVVCEDTRAARVKDDPLRKIGGYLTLIFRYHCIKMLMSVPRALISKSAGARSLPGHGNTMPLQL